jgi:hypothetical protein
VRESEEAARLDVATDSLKALTARADGPIEKNAFIVNVSSKGSLVHEKALASRGWQQTFIRRLIDYLLLRQTQIGGTIVYEVRSVTASQLVVLCIADRDYYHGILVSHLVFGGLSPDGFIKLCSKRLAEMREEEFASIQSERVRKFLEETVGSDWAAHESSEYVNQKVHTLLKEVDPHSGGEATRPDASPGEPDVPITHVGVAIKLIQSIDDGLHQVMHNQQVIVEELRSTRVNLRDSKKETEELVKSLQGLLRQNAGNAPPKLVELEANTRITSALRAVEVDVKTITTAVLSLAGTQKALIEQLNTAQDDKLGRAARDLEAVLALITEAIAERQKS